MPWNPDPPQGFSKSQGQVIIGRPPIPLFGGPQGIAAGISAPVDALLAIYPPLGDIDYSKYKFYQVNKGEFTEPQTDFIWEITDTVGPGVLTQASGFDIRPFLKDERDLSLARNTLNTFDPQISIIMMQLSDDQLHLFAWEVFLGTIHEWVLSAPRVFPADGTPSDFQFTQSEEDGRDIKFIENGTKMVIVGVANKTVEIYSLPTPNSLSSTPVLLESFDTSFTLSNPMSCEFSLDGMQLYVIDFNSDTVNQWNLTSPFTLPAESTPFDREFPFSPPINTSNGNCRMLKDGAAFYLMSNNPRQINKYINTDGRNQIPTVNKSPDALFNLSPLSTFPLSISLSVDNSLLWFLDANIMTIFELFLPGVLLEYEVVSVNVSTGEFTIKVKVPSIKDFTFIQIAFGNASATDDSTPLAGGTTLSTFETPLLTKDEDIFLVDDQGRNIMVVP